MGLGDVFAGVAKLLFYWAIVIGLVGAVIVSVAFGYLLLTGGLDEMSASSPAVEQGSAQSSNGPDRLSPATSRQLSSQRASHVTRRTTPAPR